MSDSIRLHIALFHTLYRLPSSLGAPDLFRARLDALVNTEVSAALDRVLPAVLVDLGLTPDAEIALQRLAVRVRLRSEDVSSEALAEGWARAIAEALLRTLAPLVASGGGVAADAALFAHRFDAERAYLLERFLGGAEAWWWQPLLGGGGSIPSAREVILGWIRAAPERAPSALASLAVEAPDGMSSALSEDDARALNVELLRAHEQRLDAMRQALPQRPGRAADEAAPSGSGAPADGSIEVDAPRESRRERRREEVNDLLEMPEILALLDVADLQAITRAQAPAVRRLLTICLVLAKRPAAVALLVDVVLAADTAAPGHLPEPRDNAPDDDADEAARTAARRRDFAIDVKARAPGGPPATPRRRALDDDASGNVRVGSGGLLFLIRRVAASSLLDENRGQALEDRLVALGWIALHRALHRLPEAARRAAFVRERPLLSVFSGVRTLPDDLHVTPTGAAAVDAARHLDAIAARLPADLAPCDDGVLATYGPAVEPFEPGHPDRALAHLLLRSSLLRVTPTRADLHLPARSIDVALRLGGWDIDPGFVPHLGRVIRFHYEER